MREIFQRLQRETPRFFKRLQAICLGLIAIAVSVLALDFQNYPWLVRACEDTILVCTVLVGVLNLTVKGGYKG
jgi:hypothetical protein